MKALLATMFFISFSATSHARCVVEILSRNGDPMGYIFQEKECSPAMTKCRAQLGRLNLAGARCEITMHIPGR